MTHGLQLRTYQKGGLWWATLDDMPETNAASDTRDGAVRAWKFMHGELYGIDTEATECMITLPLADSSLQD